MTAAAAPRTHACAAPLSGSSTSCINAALGCSTTILPSSSAAGGAAVTTAGQTYVKGGCRRCGDHLKVCTAMADRVPEARGGGATDLQVRGDGRPCLWAGRNCPLTVSDWSHVSRLAPGGLCDDLDRVCPKRPGGQLMLLPQQVVLELKRGLAHTDCLTGIGYFRDDPDLLELAAANLRAAQAAPCPGGRLSLSSRRYRSTSRASSVRPPAEHQKGPAGCFIRPFRLSPGSPRAPCPARPAATR